MPRARLHQEGIVQADDRFVQIKAVVGAQRQDGGRGAAADIAALQGGAPWRQACQVVVQPLAEARSLAWVQRGQGIVRGLGDGGIGRTVGQGRQGAGKGPARGRHRAGSAGRWH